MSIGVGPGPSSATKGVLIGATLVGLLIWFVPYGPTVTLPIRYFVTYLHEISHALSGYITGGYAQAMQIHPNGEGSVLVSSRYVLLTYSAGYVGSTVFGAALLLLTRQVKWSRAVFFALSGLIAFAALYWVRPFLLSFGFAIGAALAFLLFSAGRWLSDRLRVFLLQFLAVQCCLSAAQDIAALLQLNAMGVYHNDAGLLAQRTGVPAMVWAIAWTLLSATIVVLTVRYLLWPKGASASSTGYTTPTS